MCFFSPTWKGKKHKQGTGGVSDGWNKVTAERNMRSAELGLNFRIMRVYAHGKLCTWLRNSYNCEWPCGSGWRGDEVPVSLPPCCRSRPAFIASVRRVLWVSNTLLLACQGYYLLFVSKSGPNQTFHKKHQALKPIWWSLPVHFQHPMICAAQKNLPLTQGCVMGSYWPG